MRVLGAIIAGGASRRMGQDKAFVTWLGKPLIAHVLERLTPQVDEVVISVKSDAARFAPFGLQVITDELEIATPLAGLHAALIYAVRNKFDAVLSSPCDTPLLPADLLERLIHPSLGGGRWREATDGGLAANSELETLDGELAARHPSALPGTFPLRGKGVVLAGYGTQTHFLTGFWPVTVLSFFDNLASPRVKDFGALVGAKRFDWPETGLDPFINVNTVQELSDLP